MKALERQPGSLNGPHRVEQQQQQQQGVMVSDRRPPAGGRAPVMSEAWRQGDAAAPDAPDVRLPAPAPLWIPASCILIKAKTPSNDNPSTLIPRFLFRHFTFCSSFAGTPEFSMCVFLVVLLPGASCRAALCFPAAFYLDSACLIRLALFLLPPS